MVQNLFLILFSAIMSFSAQAQNTQIVNFETLEKVFKEKNDTLKIVNFWATWCGPCVAEMKYFVQAQEAYKNEKVSFTYVSIDFSKYKENVDAFIKKKGMKGKYFILKDDPNIYINKIDKNWEGNIPFTLLVLPNGTYVTHNKDFSTYEELDQFIKTNFNSKSK